MNETIESLHDQKIQSTAKELSDNGYQVSIEPSISHLPFDLGGYRPDIIATKEDRGIVLEIKTSLNRVSVDRFQDIAERVSEHQGWRFLLITLDDTSEKILLADEENLRSWADIQSQLSNLDILIRDSLFEPALLFFWSILEAALRKRAIQQNIPIFRFPAKQLLNHIFSSGEISILEFDLFKDCLEIRNRLTHGISTPLDLNQLRLANDMLKVLVKKWSDEHS